MLSRAQKAFMKEAEAEQDIQDFWKTMGYGFQLAAEALLGKMGHDIHFKDEQTVVSNEKA
jgi:hypothetical protein